ncbi:expressed unknown protein [Seminavis robusta]|uniref:Uncharacterized protein n=1 Tax=Seminavis robusta TaxID=568900 RepID=A0A9N8DB22_9STRA|nr:expressed unknown protein [Seminavis robusta]|eukprot:Sro40_g024540.1 n/a (273) ;mRNA; r:30766-31697
MANIRRDKLGLEPAPPAVQQSLLGVSSSDIDGYYLCQGQGSGSYGGHTVFRTFGETISVQCNLNGQIYIGAGLRSGNTIAVTWKIPLVYASVYTLETNTDNTQRTMRGRYCNVPADGAFGTEVLTFDRPLEDDWNVGDALLGNWSSDAFWYPGTIMEKQEAPSQNSTNRYLVRFADGDQEWLGPSRMMKDRLLAGDVPYRTGDIVYANGGDIQDNTLPLEAHRIIQRDGDDLVLQIGNHGPPISTQMRYIRTLAPREAPYTVPPNESMGLQQ